MRSIALSEREAPSVRRSHSPSRFIVDWFILLLLGLLLFLTRDVFLLATVPRESRFAKAAVTYGVVLTGVFVALGAAAEFVSRQDAVSLLRDVRFWAPGIGVHVLLGLSCRKLERADNAPRYAWLVALVPPPVFLYCAGGFCWLALRQTNALEGWLVGLQVGLISLGVVLSASWLLRSLLSQRASAGKVLSFAAAANLSAVLLVPFQQEADKSSLLAQFVDWNSTLLALAATLGLISVSFLYHRLRRSS